MPHADDSNRYLIVGAVGGSTVFANIRKFDKRGSVTRLSRISALQRGCLEGVPGDKTPPPNKLPHGPGLYARKNRDPTRTLFTH